VVDLVRSSGAEILIVNIPDRCFIDKAYWTAWVAKYHINAEDYDFEDPARRLAEFCRAHQVPLLDLNPVFQGEASRGRQLYWKIDLHLSPEGNRVIADQLGPYLNEHYSFSRGSDQNDPKKGL
jgi:lysophospholipase L1-like esterase